MLYYFSSSVYYFTSKHQPFIRFMKGVCLAKMRRKSILRADRHFSVLIDLQAPTSKLKSFALVKPFRFKNGCEVFLMRESRDIKDSVSLCNNLKLISKAANCKFYFPS